MKKHKGFIISLIILVMVYAFFCIYTHYSKILEVSSMMEHNLYYTKNINIDEEKYYINVKYPYTIYKEANEYIENNIQNFIKDFEILMKTKIEESKEKYFLNISFDTAETNKYINFVFDIQKNTGGVHIENSIFTICIDKGEKNVITIDDLKAKYNNYLEKIAKYCYNELKNLENIKEYGAYALLELGTKAKSGNYSNFILMNNNIDILFEHSQVAPYVLGTFRVVIPIKYLEE